MLGVDGAYPHWDSDLEKLVIRSLPDEKVLARLAGVKGMPQRPVGYYLSSKDLYLIEVVIDHQGAHLARFWDWRRGELLREFSSPSPSRPATASALRLTWPLLWQATAEIQ